MSYLKNPKTLIHEKMHALTTRVAVLPVKTMDESYPELSDNDQNEHVNDIDLFSIDNDPEVVIDDKNCEISMPIIFGVEPK